MKFIQVKREFIFRLLFLIMTSLIFNIYGETKMEIIKYDDQLKFYIGEGGNSVVLTSEEDDKALIIDTKYFKSAKQLRKEINSKNITIINSHFHMDHSRGNKLYKDAFVISGDCKWILWDIDSGGSKRPDKVLFPQDEYRFNFGDETVFIKNMGAGHTYSECIVLFEKRNILIAGDLIWNQTHPMVLDPSCDIENWLKSLDFIKNELKPGIVIPGHGSIGNAEIVMDMYNYFSSIKNNLYDENELSKIQKKYSDYKQVIFVCNFTNTVRKFKQDAKRN